MKSLKYLLALLLVATPVYAIDFDPSIPGQTTLTITCEYPIEREDGTPLVIGEISKVNFFVEANGVGGYIPAGENTTACRQVYDLTAVADGSYVYAVTAVDTDGRESMFSTEVILATVKRLANPRSPAGISGSRS